MEMSNLLAEGHQLVYQYKHRDTLLKETLCRKGILLHGSCSGSHIPLGLLRDCSKAFSWVLLSIIKSGCTPPCFALKILHYPSETIPCLCNSQLIYYTWVYSFYTSFLAMRCYVFWGYLFKNPTYMFSTGHLPTKMVLILFFFYPRRHKICLFFS